MKTLEIGGHLFEMLLGSDDAVVGLRQVEAAFGWMTGQPLQRSFSIALKRDLLLQLGVLDGDSVHVIGSFTQFSQMVLSARWQTIDHVVLRLQVRASGKRRLRGDKFESMGHL
jgi:hypothetical protein